jgi:hypothetical protein
MNALRLNNNLSLLSEVRGLAERHGRVATVFSVLRVALSRRAQSAMSADRLSDHLRRDIGLPPRGSDQVIDLLGDPRSHALRGLSLK